MELSEQAKLFRRGQKWDADKDAANEKNRKMGWRVAAALGLLCAVLGVSLASLAPFRRNIPYLVHVDEKTGVAEVLQTYDNRLIGKQELLNAHWAQAYVLAREEYNWWLVGGDFDLVKRLTDPAIWPEYGGQFTGEQALDKVFGASTERKIKILSNSPSPVMRDQQVVRFERTTTAKGALAEPPTRFIVTLAYRYVDKMTGPTVDLIRNPMGYQVYAYRRDPEAAPTVPAAASAPAVSATASAGVAG